MMGSRHPPQAGWSATMLADGRLPGRYRGSVRDRFTRMAADKLISGATVLDAGSGRDPVLPRRLRDPGLTYVGLDISREELELAPPGSYDEALVCNLTEHRPELDGRFDLVLSWQVFEHVERLDWAISNLRSYLRPDGKLVALLSGRFSPFAFANRCLPARAANAIARRVLRIPSQEIFPAHYHECSASGLERQFGNWSSAQIDPLYRGAVYFRFSDPLLRAYVAYESWLERGDRRELATHYLVEARR